MARGVNKVILIGHLGQDPEVRYMPSGGAVCNMRLATGEAWKDKDSGEQRERTEWHSVVVFGRLAEICGEYLKKGSRVYFEGRIQTRKWEGKDGKERYSTEIVAADMQMLDSRRDSGDDTRDSGSGNWGEKRSSSKSAGSDAPPPDDLDDDIPF